MPLRLHSSRLTKAFFSSEKGFQWSDFRRTCRRKSQIYCFLLFPIRTRGLCPERGICQQPERIRFYALSACYSLAESANCFCFACHSGNSFCPCSLSSYFRISGTGNRAKKSIMDYEALFHMAFFSRYFVGHGSSRFILRLSLTHDHEEHDMESEKSASIYRRFFQCGNGGWNCDRIFMN